MTAPPAWIATAAGMARERGIDPKRFRAALRAAGFSWHGHGAGWTVPHGGPEHRAMLTVLDALISASPRAASIRAPRAGGRAHSDEAYVIDLCDAELGATALRQHRFDFLRGDPGQGGRCARLPVDAYYPVLKLVVEYRERQHVEAVPFFDRRATVSGMGRGAQRALYDQRRRDMLPRHGLRLIEIGYADLAHDAGKRLLRAGSDRAAIARLLGGGA